MYVGINPWCLVLVSIWAVGSQCKGHKLWERELRPSVVRDYTTLRRFVSSSILHGGRVDPVPAGGQRGALQAVVGQRAGLALLAQRPPAPRTLRLALLQTLETRAAGQRVVGPHREAVLGSAVND